MSNRYARMGIFRLPWLERITKQSTQLGRKPDFEEELEEQW